MCAVVMKHEERLSSKLCMGPAWRRGAREEREGGEGGRRKGQQRKGNKGRNTLKFAGPSAQRRVGILCGWSGCPGDRIFILLGGTPSAQKHHVAEYSKSFFGPFGSPRPDLFDLLAHREVVKKS